MKLTILPALVLVQVLWLVPAAAQTEAVTPQQLQAAIEQLGALDFPIRMNAGRIVRRSPAEQAVPALMNAVQHHADGYVRYRALVLLSGFADPRTRDLMARALTDPNDRLRQVAYNYFEHNPDPAVADVLLRALGSEESEFVRPALIRALAALGGEPRVRDALLVEVDRGVDFFRSVVIEALGDYRAGYAVASLIRTARQDGPLQDDAVLALGKIGDRRALETMTSLQRTAPRVLQPSIAAGICLLGVNCAAHQRYLEESLRFAEENPGYQDLLRGAASGLAALALNGNAQALATLLDVGIPSRDPARAAVALAVGSIAMRNTPLLLDVLQRRPDLQPALLLLRDAFDMLDEDYEEERFFVTVRRHFWEAPEGSEARRVAEAAVQTLEF